MTIHDLIYRRVPQDYKPVDRAMYDFKYSRSARNATRVIAISEKTRDDLVEDYQIDPAKIDVIYQGCDPRFGLPVEYDEKQRVRAAYALPERYFISVGTVQSRKNQLLAVKALERLDLPLVIVGNRKSDYAGEVARYISSHGLSDRVMWLDKVPFADLPALYAMAEFSSYTSRYEGFGIPVIESLSAETPVIAATGSWLEEARPSVYQTIFGRRVRPSDHGLLPQGNNRKISLIVMEKSILIIGAGGFIGGFIAKAALERGYRTWVAVRQSTSRRYLSDERLNFVTLDYDDPDAMATALKGAAPEGGKWDFMIWNLGATKCANFADFNRINYQYVRDFVLMLEREQMVPGRFLFMSSLSALGEAD